MSETTPVVSNVTTCDNSEVLNLLSTVISRLDNIENRVGDLGQRFSDVRSEVLTIRSVTHDVFMIVNDTESSLRGLKNSTTALYETLFESDSDSDVQLVSQSSALNRGVTPSPTRPGNYLIHYHLTLQRLKRLILAIGQGLGPLRSIGNVDRSRITSISGTRSSLTTSERVASLPPRPASCSGAGTSGRGLISLPLQKSDSSAGVGKSSSNLKGVHLTKKMLFVSNLSTSLPFTELAENNAIRTNLMLKDSECPTTPEELETCIEGLPKDLLNAFETEGTWFLFEVFVKGNMASSFGSKEKHYLPFGLWSKYLPTEADFATFGGKFIVVSPVAGEHLPKFKLHSSSRFHSIIYRGPYSNHTDDEKYAANEDPTIIIDDHDAGNAEEDNESDPFGIAAKSSRGRRIKRRKFH